MVSAIPNNGMVPTLPAGALGAGCLSGSSSCSTLMNISLCKDNRFSEQWEGHATIDFVISKTNAGILIQLPFILVPNITGKKIRTSLGLNLQVD